MIIPLGHESNTVGRLPWVTFGLMGACLLMFLVCLRGDARVVRRFYDLLAEPVGFALEHPYLELDRRVEVMLMQALSKEDRRTFLQARNRPCPVSPEVAQREQARLDAMLEAAFAVLAERQTHRLALVPARPTAAATLTHLLVHGGWAHLLGNLLFLYLAGPFVEDKWGRLLFLPFYVLAGAFGAWIHVVRYPDSEVALIGASGAIAGVMGAFLVRFWRTRIQFFYWFGLVMGTFQAPAFLMLGLWFGWELLSAVVLDALGWGELGGVAHWVHVGGFGFGAVTATVMHLLRVEERLIRPALDARKPGMATNPAVEQAFAAREAGRGDEAYRLLRQAVARNPADSDAVLALWRLAVERRTPEAAAPAMLRLVESAVRQGDAELAAAQWLELVEHAPSVELNAATAVRLAEMLRRVGYTEPVQAAVAQAVRNLPPDPPTTLLVRLAKVARECGSPAAGQLVARALDRPDLSPEARGELTQGWITPVAGAGDAGGRRDPKPGQRALRVTEAVPVELGACALRGSVGASICELPLTEVAAVSVAAVARAGGSPRGLVDLVLSRPDALDELHVVRLATAAFDPRRLMGGSDAKAALRGFVATLLERTGAAPLPSLAAARGEPFAVYPSLAAYQREVLGMTGDDPPAATPLPEPPPPPPGRAPGRSSA